MSNDPDQGFVADGIAENIITARSRYPSLFVIARNSCFTYKGRSVDVKQIGHELGVRCESASVRDPTSARNNSLIERVKVTK
jgi:TolB-like protein